MRLSQLAVPLLAGASLVSAQASVADGPASPSVQASSITSKLNSAHRATMVPTGTTKKQTSTKKAVNPPKKTTAKKHTIKKVPSKKKTPPKKSAHKAAPKKAASKKKTNKVVAGHKHVARDAVNTAGKDTSGCTNLSPILYGYAAPNDTGSTVGSGFMLDTTMTGTAAAQLYPPAGYSTSFRSQMAALFSTNYIGYVQIPSYNTTLCAQYCNAASTCNAFNIYYERTPQYVPNINCNNPTPLAAVTCALWGDYVYNNTALNIGQYKTDFIVVITGSNGYNAYPDPATAKNYTYPAALYGGISTSTTGYLTSNTYTLYDISTCANSCTSYTAKQKTSASGATYTPCQYFNIYNTTDAKGVFTGMVCELFSNTNPTSGATQQGTTTAPIIGSYGYALYPADPGNKTVPWSPAPTGTAAACTNLPVANFGTILDYNQVNYTVACNYDVQYVGDIGNSTSPDYYSCFNLCDNFANCNAFSFLNNVCYFKNLKGSTKTPQSATGIMLGYMTNAGYAGQGASSVAATVSYTTYTTAWTGTFTSTTTSQQGLTAYVIVETPGTVSSTTTATVTSYYDSGTAASIISQTTAAANPSGTATVNIYYPTPTYCTTVNSGLTNKGARFAMYSNSASNKQGTGTYNAYQPTTVKTMSPLATGLATYIGEHNTASQSVVIYGAASRLADTLVISQTFYLYAGRGTGYYSFLIPYTDDVELVWVGNYALSGYNRTNANLYQYWTSSQTSQAPQTLAYYLTFGTYTPVRIQWGNGGGAGDMQFQITAPDGTNLINYVTGTNSGTMTPDIVTSPCQNSQGAPFPAWGSET